MSMWNLHDLLLKNKYTCLYVFCGKHKNGIEDIGITVVYYSEISAKICPYKRQQNIIF